MHNFKTRKEKCSTQLYIVSKIEWKDAENAMDPKLIKLWTGMDDFQKFCKMHSSAKINHKSTEQVEELKKRNYSHIRDGYSESSSIYHFIIRVYVQSWWVLLIYMQLSMCILSSCEKDLVFFSVFSK